MKAHLCEEHVSVFSDGQSLARKHSIWCPTKTWRGTGWKCPSTISTLKPKSRRLHMFRLCLTLCPKATVWPVSRHKQHIGAFLLLDVTHVSAARHRVCPVLWDNQRLFLQRLHNTTAAHTLCYFWPLECMDMCKYHFQSKARRKNTMLPTFFSLLN